MCGIAGIINFDSHPPSPLLLRKMIDAVDYRGPDDSGLVVSQNCALGNRRLAILDLSPTGHQPMWDAKKRYCLVYNGELYNYQRLKSTLGRQGYRFISTSDTEVVLNWFLAYGPEGLADFRGMFAFALWDRVKQELFFARDQFGIKPLHYYVDDRVCVFGSEIKSILLHPRVKKNINLSALSDYFSVGFGCVPSPKTIFTNIFKLPPGCWAKVAAAKITVSRYWDIAKVKPINIPLEDAVAKTSALLERSVASQLVADVPVGCLLSGGIDSSLVTAFAQKVTGKTLKTFSLGFEDPAFDESRYAKLVSDHLATDHCHQVFTAQNLLAVLPAVINKLDEPFGDGSLLPTYLLAKSVSRQIKVVLSGDGGDELFAGYPTYLAHKYGALFNRLPRLFTSFAKTLAGSQLILNTVRLTPLLKHSPNLTARFKLDRFFNGLDRDLASQYLNFMGPVSLADKRRLLVSNPETARPLVQKIIGSVKDRDLLTQILYLDLNLYLSEDGLVKTDRAGSYHSLEIRPPFLDVDLAEFVFSLPSGYKLRGLTLKFLLKKIAVGHLPEVIINRPKKGFGIPVHIWLKNELKPQFLALTGQARLRKQGLFNPEYVRQITTEHFTGRADHRTVLWNLFIFQLWYDRWFDKKT